MKTVAVRGEFIMELWHILITALNALSLRPGQGIRRVKNHKGLSVRYERSVGPFLIRGAPGTWTKEITSSSGRNTRLAGGL